MNVHFNLLKTRCAGFILGMVLPVVAMADLCPDDRSSLNYAQQNLTFQQQELLKPIEERFDVTMPDGIRVRVAHWYSKPHAEISHQKATVILLPGRSEYIDRYLDVIEGLVIKGYDVWAMDWRGQGWSQRLLDNSHKGHIQDFQQYLDDLHQVMIHCVRKHSAGPYVVLGHSMGGHLGLRYAKQHPQWVEGVVATAPMVDIYFPWGVRWAVDGIVWAANGLGMDDDYALGRGDYRREEYDFENDIINVSKESFDKDHDFYTNHPEVVLGGPTYGWVQAAFRSSEILLAETPGRPFDVPVLILSAENDTVVDNDKQKEFCDLYVQCQLITVPVAKHNVMVDSPEVTRVFWQNFDLFMNSKVFNKDALNKNTQHQGSSDKNKGRQ